MLLITRKFQFPTEGSSEDGKSSPPGRSYACACVYNGFLWTYGGTRAHSDTYNDLWKFDLKTHAWTLLTIQGTARPIRHTSAILYGNEMVYSGGWHTGFVNEVVRINLDTLAYQVPNTTCTNTPIPRNHLWPGQYRFGDKLLVIFPMPKDGLHLWELDLQTNIWTMVWRFDMLMTLRNHFPTFLLDDHLYFLGVYYDLPCIKFHIRSRSVEVITVPKKSVLTTMVNSNKENGGTRICVVRGRVFGLSRSSNRSTMSRFYEIDPVTLDAIEYKDVQIEAGIGFSMLPNEDLGQIVVWGGTDGESDGEGRCIVWTIEIESPLANKMHSLLENKRGLDVFWQFC